MESHFPQEPLALCLAIRLFEQRLLKLYAEGHLFGTVHTCVGQEMVGVLAARHFVEGDAFVSNHRGHGHYLGLTGDQEGLLCEVLGREGAACQGRGGTQHLYHPKGFYSNGIQGGMAPVATGLALARRLRKTSNIVFLFVGDGTLGEGTLYEALNLASKWSVPLLVVVENNGIAQTTPVESTLAGSVEGRARAFDLGYARGNTRRWQQLDSLFGEVAAKIRQSSRPFLLEIETHRLNSHSKGDDTRTKDEVQALWNADPLNQWLQTDEQAKALARQLEAGLETLVQQLLQRPLITFSRHSKAHPVGYSYPATPSGSRVAEACNQALKDSMSEVPELLMIGEDILSPYGGAFKITRDLSQLYPERVFTTPISEAAIVGVSTGLALAGYRPMAEIMFGDFLGLAFDQLVNHAAKFRFMYGDKVDVPLVVRTPMGGYRGYGPTHSQSLEKHLLGVPDLQVLAPNQRVNLYAFYRRLAQVQSPTLVVENKLLYTQFTGAKAAPGYLVSETGSDWPTVVVKPAQHPAGATVVCYGGMLALAESILEELFHEHEILLELVAPTTLFPLQIEPILDSLQRTRRLLTLEEGLGFAGFGAEVAAQSVERGAPLKALKRLTAADFVPAARQEELEVLPNASRLKNLILELVHG